MAIPLEEALRKDKYQFLDKMAKIDKQFRHVKSLVDDAVSLSMLFEVKKVFVPLAFPLSNMVIQKIKEFYGEEWTVRYHKPKLAKNKKDSYKFGDYYIELI